MHMRSSCVLSQAIRAATRTGAEVLGIERDFGTVAVGKVADFAIYSANPLLDIRNSRRVAYVVKEGVLFKGSNP